MLAHMLQAAALAQVARRRRQRWSIAALLHDVGHFLQPTDDSFGYHKHDRSGGEWLAKRFPPEVSEPVRLHVTAKRYLCAVEKDYFDKLSAASVYSPVAAGRADVGRGSPRLCRLAASGSGRAPAPLGRQRQGHRRHRP